MVPRPYFVWTCQRVIFFVFGWVQVKYRMGDSMIFWTFS